MHPIKGKQCKYFHHYVHFEMFSYAVYTIWTGIERYDGKYFKNISDGSLIELTDMERFNFEEPGFGDSRSEESRNRVSEFGRLEMFS